MTQHEAENEVIYRLIKEILSNMVIDGSLGTPAADRIKRAVIDKLNPIIGCLEVDIDDFT